MTAISQPDATEARDLEPAPPSGMAAAAERPEVLVAGAFGAGLLISLLLLGRRGR